MQGRWSVQPSQNKNASARRSYEEQRCPFMAVGRETTADEGADGPTPLPADLVDDDQSSEASAEARKAKRKRTVSYWDAPGRCPFHVKVQLGGRQRTDCFSTDGGYVSGVSSASASTLADGKVPAIGRGRKRKGAKDATIDDTGIVMTASLVHTCNPNKLQKIGSHVQDVSGEKTRCASALRTNRLLPPLPPPARARRRT